MTESTGKTADEKPAAASEATATAATTAAAPAAAGDAPMSMWLERATKYTKKWSKRFVTFAPSTRRITYAEDDRKDAKLAMTLTKILRCAEKMEARASSHDLLAMVIDGTTEDGKTEQWSLRWPDLETFHAWYRAMRGALSACGLMEPPNFGLPEKDPRNGLTFAQVPLEHLFRFQLLEKAIIYFFAPVALAGAGNTSSGAAVGGGSSPPSGPTQSPAALAAAGGGSMHDSLLAIGDKHVYGFRLNADVVRCFPIAQILKVHFSPGLTFLAIQNTPPEPDMIVRNTTKVKEIFDTLRTLFPVVAQQKELQSQPIDVSVERLIELRALRLVGDEGYKLAVVSPTPKARLRQALDMFEKQNGVKFGAPRAAAAAAAAAGAAPAGGKGGKGGAAAAAASSGKAASAASATAAAVTADLSTPLGRLLAHLELAQYTQQLANQHVDLDVLQCMDLSDLKSFGVKSDADAQRILDAANDSTLVAAMLAGSFAARNASFAAGGNNERANNLSLAGAPATSPKQSLTDPTAGPLSFPSATSTSAAAGGNNNNAGANGGGIDLSDDDLDIPPPVKGGSSTALGASQRPPLILDDSDDDLDLMPTASGAGGGSGGGAAGGGGAGGMMLPEDDDDI